MLLFKSEGNEDFGGGEVLVVVGKLVKCKGKGCIAIQRDKAAVERKALFVFNEYLLQACWHDGIDVVVKRAYATVG